MGLVPGWLKRKAGELAASRLGKALAMGVIGKFLATNKKTISGALIGVASWAWYQDCGIIFGVDVLALLQRISPAIICDGIQHLLQIVAALLAGAGIQDPREWISNVGSKKTPEQRLKKQLAEVQAEKKDA